MSETLQVGTLVHYRKVDRHGGVTISRGELVHISEHHCTIRPEPDPHDPHPSASPFVNVPINEVAERLEHLIQRLQVREALGKPDQLPRPQDSW